MTGRIRLSFHYTRMARFWAWVFLIVGLLFAIDPMQVGMELTRLANGIGLSGVIHTPQRTLWHVLALSLMATIIVSAFYSARLPDQKGPYYALLWSKGISTLGFSILALKQAPAWWICALGDAFVGGSLWLSYLTSFPRLPQLRADFAPRFQGQRPFYEVWFGRLHMVPGLAFWFRYTLLNGRISESATWAVLFNNGKIVAEKDTADLSHLSRDPYLGQPQAFQRGPARLAEGVALGQAGPLTWDLHFKDSNNRRFEHVPKILQLLGLAKSTLSSCYLDLQFTGKIRHGAKEYDVASAPGMIGHIYGRRHAQEWAWAHCNVFDQSNVVFEGLSARLRVGPWTTRLLSSFILIVGPRRYAFSSIKLLMTSRAQCDDTQWTFQATHKGVRLSGKASFSSTDNTAIVPYTDTDGSSLWCRHSQLAHLTLHLNDTTTGLHQTFVATGTAAFERVNRRRPAHTRFS